MKRLELRNVKGCDDYGGENEIIRNYISDTLRKIFEKYGYKPLSTSSLCYYDLLALKYNEDNDILKEIYRVTDQANRKLALRYDLTVPFAKYIALNQNIKLPFKRYEIGKVYRDGPVKLGRVREFVQCDVDCVGVEGQMVEAELLELYVEGFKKLGIDVIIKYNNRKILTGLIEKCKISESKIADTITIIDKFEKLSREEIIQEFKESGLVIEQIDELINYLNMDFEQIKEEFKETKNYELKNGIQEVAELNKYIEELNLSKYVKFAATLARGQDYYTGTIFEVYQKNGEIKSSIGGGGRYDNMIGDFIGNGKKYPAVGISFGLDAIFAILKDNKSLSKNMTDVYIIPMNNKSQAMKIATILRNQNKKVDVEMSGRKIKKSFEYANKENIPFVIVIGDDELERGKVTLKDMKTGEQKEIDIKDIEKEV